MSIFLKKKILLNHLIFNILVDTQVDDNNIWMVALMICMNNIYISIYRTNYLISDFYTCVFDDEPTVNLIHMARRC